MPLLTVAQAAARRGVTRMSVHRWIRAGLPAVRIGSQWVIEPAALDAFQPRPPGNPAFAAPRRKRPRKAAGKARRHGG